MIKTGKAYKIKELELTQTRDGEKVSRISIIDANWGHPVWYDVITRGEVIANIGDEFVIGKIEGVYVNQWSQKYHRTIKTPRIYCTITGVNVIP